MGKFRSWFYRFMQGRYGGDKLNMALLSVGAILSVICMFVGNPALALISYVLLIWALYRSLSRKTYQRYQENRKFLMFFQRLRDREHRYYDCPRCRQQIRVPRGKGKIAIRCPKCQERFIKKT